MDTETESDHYRFKPLRMSFTNMFVYRGDWEVTFPDGVVGLFGDNGVGKSSIIDIMIFALYKKTLRGKQQHEIVTHGEKECKVFIEFESGGTVYRIYRESGIANRTRNNNAKKELRAGMRFWQVNSDGTLIDLTEGSLNDTYNAVAAVIGKYEVLSDIGAMIQGNNKYFADQDNKDRSERLNSILNLDIFDKLLKQVKPESTECKRRLDDLKKDFEKESEKFSEMAPSEVKRELNHVRTILAGKRQLEKKLAGQNIADIREVRDELAGRNVGKVYAETEDQVAKLQHLIENLPNGQPDLKITVDLEAEYNYAVELEARVFAERRESGTRRAELLSARNKYPPKSKLQRDAKRLEELNDEIGYITSNILSAQQAAEALKKHEYDPNCKFCVKNILVERAREQLKQLPYLQKRLKSLEKEHKSVENADELYRTVNEIDKQLSLLPESEGSYDVAATEEWQKRGLKKSSLVLKHRLANERRMLQGQIERQCAEKHLSKLHDHLKRLKPLLNCNFEELSSLEEGIQNLIKKERVLMEKFGRAKECAKRLRKLKEDVIQCDIGYEAYKKYEAALGRDGIQKTLRNRMIRDLEAQMNAIIGSLAPFNIKIEEKTSMIRFVRDVRRNDAEMLAYMASGSEKLLIELSLRTVMATRAKHSSNMLILDESLSFLDSNKREVLNGLFVVLNKYFKTVLVISHDINVKEHVQKLLEVKKGVNWDEIRDNMPLDR
jgi:DNA repair exonuclease SbcCD ATPase subunit